jgi:hypothetical protein
MADRERASQARRRLLEAARAVVRRCEELAMERGPLLRGAFQLRGTRCGKENCKCNVGELHTTAVLVVSEDGKRRSYYVRGPDRPKVQQRVERYQRVRAARIKVNRLISEALSAADELLEALAEPHVPRPSAKGRQRGQSRQGRRKS